MKTRKSWAVSLIAAWFLAPMLAGVRAEEVPEKIDTQFILGFTSGADVGELGEKQLEPERIILQGKRSSGCPISLGPSLFRLGIFALSSASPLPTSRFGWNITSEA